MNKAGLLLLGLFLVLGYIAAPFLTANQDANAVKKKPLTISADTAADDESEKGGKLEIANFGAGCFWCVEAVFQQLKGVQSVESGYMGGSVLDPTYDQVCSGLTGHAEIAQIKFDPNVISFAELLEVFWKTHDPTTLNRQGNDDGTQYRSAIFFTTNEQKELAEKYKRRLNEANAFRAPIVTEVTAASEFYTAGGKHKDYYLKNSNADYCQIVIQPKVDKFRKVFADKLKK